MNARAALDRAAVDADVADAFNTVRDANPARTEPADRRSLLAALGITVSLSRCRLHKPTLATCESEFVGTGGQQRP
jgi:hypothetical protein